MEGKRPRVDWPDVMEQTTKKIEKKRRNLDAVGRRKADDSQPKKRKVPSPVKKNRQDGKKMQTPDTQKDKELETGPARDGHSRVVPASPEKKKRKATQRQDVISV